MFALITYFTENPWPVLFVLALVELVLIITIKVRGQGMWLKLAFAVPVVAAIVVLVELLIVTDREAVKSEVKSLADAVREENMDRILSHISRDYDDGGVTYETFKSNVTVLLGMLDLDSVTLFFEEIEAMRDGRMMAKFKALTIGKVSSVPYGSHPSRWQIYLRQTDGRWLVCQIVPLEAKGTEAWPYVRRLMHGP